MIDNPKSLLPLVVFDDATTWNDLLKLPDVFLEPNGLDRLVRCLGYAAKSVVIERHYIDKDYRDTFSAFHSKKFSTPYSRCDRLHFFAEPLIRDQLGDETLLRRAYIGYAVIRPTRPNSIGRTLLDSRKLAHPEGWMCHCRERVSLQGVELEVEGFPFISQDSDVTVCAQSALWMLLRFFSNRFPIYREIYPSEIALLVKDFSIGRIFPSPGLTDWQMAECLRQIGFSPLIYTRKAQKDPAVFDRLLYTYIESGIPVLASVEDHVVVAFGHRSDFTKASPDGDDWFSSAHYNDAWIVSDDNGVPYEELRARSGPVASGSTLPAPYVWSHLQSFIVPLPQRVFLPAEDMGKLVGRLLHESPFAIARRSPRLAASRVVRRIFLTTCRSFKRRLAARGMGHPLALNLYRMLPLPHFIWVCELATMDGFGRHEVLGEVLWDATRNAHEQNGWIAIHYPEVIIFDRGSALNRPPEHREFALPDGVAYPVYSHNLREHRPRHAHPDQR